MQNLAVELTEPERYALEQLLRRYGEFMLMPAHRSVFEKLTGEKVGPVEDTLF